MKNSMANYTVPIHWSNQEELKRIVNEYKRTNKCDTMPMRELQGYVVEFSNPDGQVIVSQF